MTDRIQAEFELFAQREGFDVEQYQGRYVRPVTRNMWLAWQYQLLRQCRDHDTRRVAAVQQAQALADEVARLNETIGRLAAEGQDAHGM